MLEIKSISRWQDHKTLASALLLLLKPFEGAVDLVPLVESGQQTVNRLHFDLMWWIPRQPKYESSDSNGMPKTPKIYEISHSNENLRRKLLEGGQESGRIETSSTPAKREGKDILLVRYKKITQNVKTSNQLDEERKGRRDHSNPTCSVILIWCALSKSSAAKKRTVFSVGTVDPS